MADQRDRFAHADDLSWLVGRLQRENFEGGFWRIEFGAEDAPHGGSLVLGNPPALAGMREGALVRVEGHVDADRMSIWMAGTIYDVRRAQELPDGEAAP